VEASILENNEILGTLNLFSDIFINLVNYNLNSISNNDIAFVLCTHDSF